MAPQSFCTEETLPSKVKLVFEKNIFSKAASSKLLTSHRLDWKLAGEKTAERITASEVSQCGLLHADVQND